MKEFRLLIIAGAIVLPGCHGWARNSACHAPQEYQRAAQLVPLKVPAGLDAPNTSSALVIPTVEGSAPVRGPKDACLDAPPKYKASAAK